MASVGPGNADAIACAISNVAFLNVDVARARCGTGAIVNLLTRIDSDHAIGMTRPMCTYMLL